MKQSTYWPAAERLVAIGDLHGDMGKARRAFRLGGLIDDNDRWCGGTATAVQVGLFPRCVRQLALHGLHVAFKCLSQCVYRACHSSRQ